MQHGQNIFPQVYTFSESVWHDTSTVGCSYVSLPPMVLAYDCCLHAVIINTSCYLRNGSHSDDTLYSRHTDRVPGKASKCTGECISRHLMPGKDLTGSVGGILLAAAC